MLSVDSSIAELAATARCIRRDSTATVSMVTRGIRQTTVTNSLLPTTANDCGNGGKNVSIKDDEAEQLGPKKHNQ